MESRIDTLIGGEMADPTFLRRLAMGLQSKTANETASLRVSHLDVEIKSLAKKRNRIIDLFTEGDITREEKAVRLASVSEQIRVLTEELSRLKGSVPAGTTLEQLAALFSVFIGWDTWEDRRKLLALYAPRMRVRDGQVVSVYRLLDNAETRADSAYSMSRSSSAPRRSTSRPTAWPRTPSGPAILAGATIN
jgi:hypothetical protein